MDHLNKEEKSKFANKLKAELRQFRGDILRYQHPINREVIYTHGVRHLANETSTYWLIDAIASWIVSPEFLTQKRQDARIGQMHFWHLKVDQSDRSAVLYAEADTGCPRFIEQEIPFTDFLLEEICIWAAYDGRHWVLYLPSEH